MRQDENEALTRVTAGRDGAWVVGSPALLRPFGLKSAAPLVGEAILLIRPTGVQVVDTHADEHHLAGTVADVAFRGRGYEHAIDISGGTRLTGVFAEARARRGEVVGLRMDPAGCHLFPAGS